MMQREFIKDGWKFRVTVHDYTCMERKVSVRAVDTSLPNPSTEDVYSVEVRNIEKERHKKHFLGIFPYYETERYQPFDSVEEQVDAAMEKMCELLEDVDRSPSERLDAALEKYRAA